MDHNNFALPTINCGAVSCVESNVICTKRLILFIVIILVCFLAVLKQCLFLHIWYLSCLSTCYHDFQMHQKPLCSEHDKWLCKSWSMETMLAYLASNPDLQSCGRLIESGRPSSSRPKPRGAFRRGEIKGFGLSEICSETSYTHTPLLHLPPPAAEQIVLNQGLEARAHNMLFKFVFPSGMAFFNWMFLCHWCDIMHVPYPKAGFLTDNRFVSLVTIQFTLI